MNSKMIEELKPCPEMVEKVARAICRVHAERFNRKYADGKSAVSGEFDACGDEGRAELLEDARAAITAYDPDPIPMLLYCPQCGQGHVDEPDDRTPEWTNPPHRSHLCHDCGCIWRPADVPTNGVASLKTQGKADTWTTERGNAESAAAYDPDKRLREALEHDVREVAEGLSIEAQLTAPILSEEGRLRAKMGEYATTLFRAIRAALSHNGG